jgi:hypothetical protein
LEFLDSERYSLLQNKNMGRPYRTGHPNSLANLSQPGHTNNPGGRPRKTPLTDALRMLCDPDSKLKVPDLEERKADSIAVAAAKAVLREAVRGKPAAFSEVADRIEGRVTQRLEHGGGAEPIPLSLDVHDRIKALAERLRTRKPDRSDA